jgi:hypothetical protein
MLRSLRNLEGLLDMYRPDDLIKLDPQVEGKVMVIRVKEVSIGYV